MTFRRSFRFVVVVVVYFFTTRHPFFFPVSGACTIADRLRWKRFRKSTLRCVYAKSVFTLICRGKSSPRRVHVYRENTIRLANREKKNDSKKRPKTRYVLAAAAAATVRRYVLLLLLLFVHIIYIDMCVCYV